MGNCIIVCNGDVEDYIVFKSMFDKYSLVICSDGGSRHLRKVGITPQIIIGDFDSSDPEDIKYFVDQGSQVIKFPTDKNYTDTELAFYEAINMGYENIKILSCTGQRLDHTLANIFLLKKAVDRGVECSIQNESNKITMLKGYQTKIFNNEQQNYNISLLPISEVCKGITITGVKYPLKEATITMGDTIGISNEFKEQSAQISIKEGLLLVTKSKKTEKTGDGDAVYLKPASP